MTSKAVIPGIIGLDVDATYTGTTTDGQNSPYTLGTRVFDTQGNEYMLVQAAAALMAATTDPNALAIDENFQASLMTTALAQNSYELGFAPRAIIADNAFFWARVGGLFTGRVAASAAADTYLRTTITAGRLGTASTASAVVFTGCVITTAASASTSAGNTSRSVFMTKGKAVRSGNSTFVN